MSASRRAHALPSAPALLRPSLHPPFLLAAFGLALWLLMLPAVAALVLDARLLEGAPVWLKPLKFLASLGLFALSSAQALACASGPAQRGRTAWGVLAIIVTMSLFELGYIGWQAAQAEPSHFNTRDRFHALMYSLMGAGAVLLTATSGMLVVLVARHGRPTVHALLRLAVVLGFALTAVLGILTGALMSTQPGHFVGHPAGGATLPLLGWSLAGGDHRVAHFLGLHVQQGLPLAGWALARRGVAPGRGRLILGLLALGWCVGVAAAMLQALRGQPFHGG